MSGRTTINANQNHSLTNSFTVSCIIYLSTLIIPRECQKFNSYIIQDTNISSAYYNKVCFLKCHLLWSFQTVTFCILNSSRYYKLLSMEDIQMLCVLCISCQRLQSCSLYAFRTSESAVRMPDQFIYGDRGVQMGTNRYFILRRMVIFGTFRVHIGKNRMKPRFFRHY